MQTKLSVLALAVLVASQTGCRNCGRLGLIYEPEPICPAPSAPCDTAPAVPAPCDATAQPDVEVRAPETIHVKAPPQKITVTLPSNCEAGSACAGETNAAFVAGALAPAAPPGFAPPGFAPPQYAPTASAPMGYAPVALAPAAVPTGSTQTVRQRNRIALGLEFIRIPLPYPKILAMPGEQEVITRQTYQAPAAAPIPAGYAPMMAPAAPVAYAPAAPMGYAPAAPAQYAPVQYAPVQYAPAAPVAYAPAAPVQYAPVSPPPVQYAPQPPQAAVVPTTLQGMICIPSPNSAPCGTPCATPPSAPGRPLR
jgi:hypothetical protein